MFKIFQNISAYYWKHFEKFFIEYLLILAFSLAAMHINCWNDWVSDAFIQNSDFNKIASLVSILIGLFGFGIAFVGSQSIQYSLTKIMARYKYLELLVITILLLCLLYIFPQVAWLGLATLITLLFISIHTLFLIDKMFEPEELIVEVICPLILQHENFGINNRPSKKASVFYDILTSFNKIKVLGYNSTTSIVMGTNAELDGLGKAIYRLLKSHSLKTTYLLGMIKEYINSHNKYLHFHDDYSNKINADDYQCFLLSYVAYLIVSLGKENSEFEIAHQNLALYILSILISKEENPLLDENNVHSKKYGELRGNFVEIILPLRDKTQIIGLMQSFIEKKGDSVEQFHNDYILQTFGIYIIILVDFIRRNFLTLLHRQGFSRMDENNLLAIVELGNAFMKRPEINDMKGYNLFIEAYCELSIFLIDLQDLMYQSDNMENIKTYFTNLFPEKDNALSKKLLDKMNLENREHMCVKDKEYHEYFIKTLKAITLNKRTFGKTKDRLERFQKNLKNNS